MPIPDPASAPPRTDLPWLRHRDVPTPAAAAPDAAVPAAAAPTDAPTDAQPASRAVADFFGGHADRPRRGAPAVPAPPTPPAPASPPPASPPPASSAPASSAGSSSLDLDEPTSPAEPPRASRTPLAPPASPPAGRRYVPPRAVGNQRLRLSPTDPTVTLTRLQTGIGMLTIEAAASAEVGDLRIGAAYELADGFTSTVQSTQGNRHAPPDSRRPVLVAGHDRFQRILLDCRQCASLRRMVVYAFSEARAPLNWGGTLTVETFGGARIEAPMEGLVSGDVAALVSLYFVRGEFVVRAEMQTLFGDVRDVCQAYGFDRISWVDARTPLD